MVYDLLQDGNKPLHTREDRDPPCLPSWCEGNGGVGKGGRVGNTYYGEANYFSPHIPSSHVWPGEKTVVIGNVSQSILPSRQGRLTSCIQWMTQMMFTLRASAK